ncbi:MAG: DNA polymerase I [Parcubacteria group bacterium]|nr:DNA polymerase I [Parcubacteria group bacterium]
MKRLILIDSHALIHRAYHALPPLTTKSGELVNAVYGFTSILIKTISGFKPDYIVAAFDAPGATFRHEEYKEYKATRVKAPDELYIQIPRVKEILNAFKIPIFEKSGFEADDIIGTISKNLRGKNVEVLILTGDMDNFQLVGKNVKVLYSPPSAAKEQIVYDSKKVEERFGGLKPEQLIDFKGLKGDPSDNIPGVKGIGEKTAIALIDRFENIENLYKTIKKGKIKEISAAVFEKLKTGKEAAFFSKKLATIKQNVPIKFNLKESEFGKFDKEKLFKLLGELGFVSLVNRMGGAMAGKPRGSEATLRGSPSSAKAMAGRQGTLAMPPSADIKGQIGYDFKSFIKTPKGKKIVIGGGDFDVMIAAYILNPGERDYSLEKLSLGEFGAVLPKTEAVLKLAPILKNRLIETETEKVFKEIEMPLIPVLAKMEIAGIKMDVKKINKLDDYLGKELKKLENEIYKLAGGEFNINSPQQLSEILFFKLKIPGALAGGRIRKTPGGALSTGAAELEKLRSGHKIIDFILKYRELAKLKSTYTDTLPKLVDKNKRIHTTFNQAGTASGRLSSQDPNLQNIPARGAWGDKVRKAFIAEKGYKFLSVDYSQIHLRIIAALADDKKMIEAFKNGLDIHKFTASEINNVPIEKVTGEMRFAAKALNFGIIYGMGALSFAESAGVSREKAREFITEYLKDFSGIARYMEILKNKAKELGFTETLFGRRRYLPEIDSPNPMLRAQAERIAVNMPIQGLEADIIKKAMIEIDKWLRGNDNIRMILQVHDELLFEVKTGFVKEAAKKIVELMESVIKLKVPIIAEAKVGDNWGEMEPYKKYAGIARSTNNR